MTRPISDDAIGPGAQPVGDAASGAVDARDTKRDRGRGQRASASTRARPLAVIGSSGQRSSTQPPPPGPYTPVEDT